MAVVLPYSIAKLSFLSILSDRIFSYFCDFLPEYLKVTSRNSIFPYNRSRSGDIIFSRSSRGIFDSRSIIW